MWSLYDLPWGPHIYVIFIWSSVVAWDEVREDVIKHNESSNFYLLYATLLLIPSAISS